MAWSKVKINSFLKERPDRIKPDTANEMGLNRLEKIDFSGNIHINQNKPTRTGMIYVKKGDLVISGINVEKGALAVYEGEEDLVATIHYSSYSYDKDKIDIEFLKWFLKSQSFKNILLTQTKGGIKTELKPKRFLPLEVYLPDLTTQIEIRNKLNSVNEEVSEVTQLQCNNDGLIQQLRQAILSEAIRGKLVPQDPNDEPASLLLEKIKFEKAKLIKEKKIRKEKTLPPIIEDEISFELPESWSWTRLLHVCQQITDGEHQTPPRISDGKKLLSAKNVRDGYINYDHCDYISEEHYNKARERCCPQKGDLLIVSVGGTIGRTSLIEYDDNFALVRSVALIKPLFLNSKYLRVVLNSNFLQGMINLKKRGGAQPCLYLSVISNFIFPLPPIQEQKRIVKKVDELMGLCDELGKQVAENQTNSTNLMDAILREAFAREA